MAGRRLKVDRAQILAFRRNVSGLDERSPSTADTMRSAAWVGLQDSMPRAAVLSMHARLERIEAGSWEHPSLVQLWGPRFSAYVVAERDRAPFTLGRLPDDPKRRRRAEETADRLEAFLGDRRMKFGEAGRGLGIAPNALRYAAPTGRVLMRWDGARQPVIWMVPPPAVDPLEARLELARRYLHVFGPSTATSFSTWAGIKPPRGTTTFEALATELVPVETPVGDEWILAGDEAALRSTAERHTALARLLPSGDSYFLLQGADREVLVPDPQRRGELWTSRVWPGAVLVDGEVAGTWRRAGPTVTVQTWQPMTAAAREAVEAEATSFPLPDVEGRIQVRWQS